MTMMRLPGILAFAAIFLGSTIGGCSSAADYAEQTRASSTRPWTISPKPTTEESIANAPQEPRSLRSEPGSPNHTIADYLSDERIAATPIHRGDPGAPQIDVVFPGNWTVASQQIPDDAYGVLLYTGEEAQSLSYPPNIVAVLTKLDGNVEREKLLEFAGGELKNLPAFVPVFDEPTTVSGHPAYRIGGGYDVESVKAAAAQETVIIEGSGGLYVLQLNATSDEREAELLYDGLGAIAESVEIKS
jgi:hypothetical protein